MPGDAGFDSLGNPMSLGTRLYNLGLRTTIATPSRRGLLAAALLCAVAALFAGAPAAATSQTEWVGPASLDEGPVGADPSLAMNANGTAVASWWYNKEAWAGFYSNGIWGTPVRLDLDHEFAWQVFAPHADIDDAGRAVVCWMVYYLDTNNATEWGEAYAALYTPGSGWTPERLLGPADIVTGDTPACAIGVGGRAFVTFLDSSDPGTTYIRLATYIPGSSWQSTTALASNASGDLSAYARVSADEQMAAIAWDLIDANYSGLGSVATTYTVADGWSTPTPLNAGEVGLLDLDVTAGVARFLLLGPLSGSNRTVVLYSCSQAGVWAGPLTVGGPGPLPSRGVIAADAGGNVTVSWSTQPNGTTRDLWGRYYSAATGWGNQTLLEDLDGRVQTRGVAPDQNGGALVVFAVSHGGYNTTYWVRYVPGAGWRAAQGIHATPLQIGGVALASSPTAALAMWYEDDGITWHLQSYPLLRDDEAPNVAIVSPALALYNTSTVHFSFLIDPLWRVSFDGEPIAVGTPSFFQFDLELSDGTYSYTIEAMDDDYNRFTGVLTFTVDTVSHLEIFDPAEGTTTDGFAVGIRGMGEPGGSVTVDGVPVPVAGNGSFAYVALLQYGVNQFDVVATDVAGNRANATVQVTQVLPETTDEEARAQIANLTQNLSEAQAELEGARAEMAALEAEANVSAAELAAAEARVGRAEGNVTTLQGQLAAANAAAAAAQASAQASRDAAGGASMIAILGLAVGAAGLALGVLSLMRGRKGGATGPPAQSEESKK